MWKEVNIYSYNSYFILKYARQVKFNRLFSGTHSINIDQVFYVVGVALA